MAISTPHCFGNSWYQTCSDIVGKKNDALIVSITTSVLIVVGNIASLVFSVFRTESGKPFLAIVVSININHLLCALYLCIAWVADVVFETSSVVQSKSWRSGPICFSAYGIIISHTLLCQLLMILLSLSRFRVVVSPMKSAFKKFNFTLKCLANLGLT